MPFLRRHGPTLLVLALLVATAVAFVVSERVKRKAPWRLFFNVGQYELTLLATWGVMALAGHPYGLGSDGLEARDLLCDRREARPDGRGGRGIGHLPIVGDARERQPVGWRRRAGL